MKKRLLSALLTFCMVLTLLPVSALAVPGDSEGVYDNKDEAYTATQVTANKELSENQDGTYTITLSVKGFTKQDSTTTMLPADVVLVVDTSTSMADGVGETRVCGSTSFHEAALFGYRCDACNAWYRENPGQCTNQIDVNRLDVAKDAASDFVSGLLSASDSIKIGLYDFSGSNRTNTPLTNDEDTLLSAIERLDMPSWGDGTDYGLGLRGAENILEASDSSRQKFIVFLSDGEPSNGEYGITEANRLKTAGVTIFTVGIDLNQSENGALVDISSQDDNGNAYYWDASSSGNALQEVLDQISETIQSTVNAGTNAVMTDVINTDSFELITDPNELPEGLTYDNNGKLTWNIDEITGAQKSLSFKIKLKDDNTTYGELHTNNSVQLTFHSTVLDKNVIFEAGAIGDPTVLVSAPQHTITINYVDGDGTSLQVPTTENKTQGDSYSYTVGSEALPKVITGNDGMQYVYDRLAEDSAELNGMVTGPVTITAIYSVDANEDEVPDKYQKQVTFKVVNGTWEDGTTDDIVTYVELKGEDGKWNETGSGTLTAPTGMVANEGFINGKWDKEVPATVFGTAAETYTYTFEAQSQTVQVVIYRNGNTTTPYATIPVVGDHEIGDTISISGLNISDYYTEGGTPGEDYVFEGWYNDGGWNDYLAGDPNNTLGETITVSGWTNIICMVTDYERVVVYGVTDGVKTDDDVLYSGKALHGENVIDYLEENVENLNRDGYTHDEWFKWDAYGTEIKFGDTDVVSGWTNVYVAYTTQIPDEPTYDDLKDLGFKILVTDKNSPIPHGNLTYNLLEHTYTLSQESATSYRIILNVADYAARYDVDKDMPEGTHVSTTTQGKAYFDITWEAGQWTCDDLTETIGVKCTAPDAPSAEELSDLIKITVKDFADGTVTEGATDHGNQIFAPAEGTYTVTDVTPNQDTKTYTATLTLTDGAAYAGLFDDILGLENGTHTLTTTISKLDPITLTYDPATGNWTANRDGWSLGVKCEPEDITPDQYTIVYHGNGGYVTSNPDKDQTTSTANVGEETTLKNADTFTRDGYVFQGWALTAEGEVAYQGSQKVTFDAQAGDKVNLYAVWAEDVYTIHVSFNDNDNEYLGGGDVISTYPDQELGSIPTPTAPEGMTFVGWKTLTGLETLYNGEFTFTALSELVNGNWTEDNEAWLTFEAVYTDTADEYHVIHVSFVDSDETTSLGGGDVISTYPDQELGSIPTPTAPEGMTFAGWKVWLGNEPMYEGEFTFTALEALYEELDGPITWVNGEEAWLTFEAVYSEKADEETFTVTFDSNGGSSVNAQTVESGKTVAKPADPTRDGYDFEGWFTDEDLTIKYDFNTPVTADITLYAAWDKQSSGGGGGGGSETETYAVYYHSNYGSDERKTGGRYEENDEVEVRDNDWWDRDNYRFLGWNTEEDGSGRDYDPEDTFDMPDEDVHLYAQWRRTASDPSDSGTDRWLETQDHRLYMVGYPDDTFGPDRNMTRAEVAQMFYALLLDQNISYTENFSDVPSDAWYAEAVNTLAALGMIDGYPDGTFRPDATITRAEFCVIALAFAYEPESFDCSFYDVSVNDWFYDYVAQATSYGWISGGSGAFRPNDAITRAEVSVIVNNMLGRVADEDYVDRHEDELTTFPDVTSSYWAYYSIMETTNSHDYTKSNGTENWR